MTGDPRPGREPGSWLPVAGYSFLILFLELALIRFVPGYVRVFGFYLNFVLIAAFLGMGVGLLRAESHARLQWLGAPAVLGLLVAVWAFANVVVRAPIDPDEFLWGVFSEIAPSVRRIGILPAVIILFTLCAAVFIPLGAALGASFEKLRPLEAYSVNLAASLLGVVTFGAASALRTTPPAWFGLVFLVWCALVWPNRRLAGVLLGAGMLAVGLSRMLRGPGAEYWSPYYRVGVYRTPESYSVHVNGSFHQYILNLSPDTTGLPYAARARQDYLRPFAFVPRVDTALVLGAGTGNDVALLLQQGARYIDAVEIDPVILDLGRAAHYQRPYGDPRVHAYVNDARAFLRATQRRYDVIVLGTLDSQTLLSGISSLRLDNYVYTAEAFAAMRDRLKPDGRLVTYHMSPYPYIAGKIAGVMALAFGRPPLVFHEPHHRLFNYTFVTGPAWTPPSDTVTASLPAQVALPRDDWPYLYLRRHVIPEHYLKALAVVLLVAVAMVRWGAGSAFGARFEGPMFFLGAGFLLLETKSVSEMSLLFGATWVVNLLVFASILIVMLAANLVALLGPRPAPRTLFVGLLLSLGIAFAVPVRDLLEFGPTGQWVSGAALVGLPVFFAAWIFAILFRDHPAPARALAYNILGATVGGILEYSSLALGIKALYLVAAVMYLAAWLFYRGRLAGLRALSRHA